MRRCEVTRPFIVCAVCLFYIYTGLDSVSGEFCLAPSLVKGQVWHKYCQDFEGRKLITNITTFKKSTVSAVGPLVPVLRRPALPRTRPGLHLPQHLGAGGAAARPGARHPPAGEGDHLAVPGE